MTQFRKKPVVIEAHQWFKNGDHPDDYSRDHDGLEGGEPRVFTGAERKANGWEGDVVRYFRHPGVPGEQVCQHCGNTMHVHGWIDTLEGGHNVCPGDWIITGVKGERYPCKPDIFAMTYEAAETPSPSPAPAQPTDRPESMRCAGCDLINGCPEYCRCSPAESEADHSVKAYKMAKALADHLAVRPAPSPVPAPAEPTYRLSAAEQDVMRKALRRSVKITNTEHSTHSEAEGVPAPAEGDALSGEQMAAIFHKHLPRTKFWDGSAFKLIMAECFELGRAAQPQPKGTARDADSDESRQAFSDAADADQNMTRWQVWRHAVTWALKQATQSPAPAPDERGRLRAAQAAAVMPLIGPLLDAWENADHDALEDQTELVKQMEAINTSMETAGDGDDWEALAFASPAVGAEPVAWVVWAENGNCIMWSTSKAAAEDVAKNYGRPLTALYSAPPDHTAAMTAAADALRKTLAAFVSDREYVAHRYGIWRGGEGENVGSFETFDAAIVAMPELQKRYGDGLAITGWNHGVLVSAVDFRDLFSTSGTDECPICLTSGPHEHSGLEIHRHREDEAGLKPLRDRRRAEIMARVANIEKNYSARPRLDAAVTAVLTALSKPPVQQTGGA